MQVGRERLRDLLGIETVLTLNEAFCEHHRQKCLLKETQATFRIMQQCDQVTAASAELRDEYYRIGAVHPGEPGNLCVNEEADPMCNRWASEGSCNSNAGATESP